MAIREAQARWLGNLKSGSGEVKLESGVGMRYSFPSRFEAEAGGNPEELLGASLASCFAMALAARLEKEQLDVERIEAIARVSIDRLEGGDWRVTRIALDVKGLVDGLDEAAFKTHAEATKETCPIAQALSGVELVLESAQLLRHTNKAPPAPPPSENNV